MPSGSKRRKAAKKKKENQPNNPNSSSVSPRSQGDDDVKHQYDVGEVSSPGSQDHHSNEQEEIEAGENTGKIEVVDKPNKEAEDESVIVIEREIKNETSRKSYDGGSSDSSGSSSSSSSGSDDESHAIKSSDAVVDISPVLDSVQVIDEVIYSASTEDAHDSVEEIIADVEALKEKVGVSSDSPANSYALPHIVESVFNEEIEEKKVSCAVEAEVGIVEDSQDAVLTPVENIISISETKECVAQETDDRLSLACDAPISTADNGADIEEISGVTEPLLAPAPHPVEKTSWKCCCGLFDVFTGSGR